jgi:hypothetical protein
MSLNIHTSSARVFKIYSEIIFVLHFLFWIIYINVKSLSNFWHSLKYHNLVFLHLLIISIWWHILIITICWYILIISIDSYIIAFVTDYYYQIITIILFYISPYRASLFPPVRGALSPLHTLLHSLIPVPRRTVG